MRSGGVKSCAQNRRFNLERNAYTTIDAEKGWQSLGSTAFCFLHASLIVCCWRSVLKHTTLHHST